MWLEPRTGSEAPLAGVRVLDFSELLPHTAQLVDELALIQSVTTNAINHDPACTFVMTRVSGVWY